jgi:hypothetical protein
MLEFVIFYFVEPFDGDNGEDGYVGLGGGF